MNHLCILEAGPSASLSLQLLNGQINVLYS